MHRNIRVPKRLSPSPIIVEKINVQAGDRVRQQQILAYLHTPKKRVPIIAPSDGWIKFIATKEKKHVKGGDLLFIIDIMATEDYRVDPEEINNASELGANGRRGLERDGQQQFAKAYAAELFDSPEAHQEGFGKEGTKEHPLMANAKEGVPLKMSAHVADNQAAMDQFSEEAGNDPELQKQLSNELRQELSIQSSPSTTPTLSTPRP